MSRPGHDPCVQCKAVLGANVYCCFNNCKEWQSRKGKMPILTACAHCHGLVDCRPDLHQSKEVSHVSRC